MSRLKSKKTKIEPAGGAPDVKTSSDTMPVTDSTIRISDLYGFVKTYDKEFSPKDVDPLLLNKDGTPKVFYYGTSSRFTAFDIDEVSYNEGSFFFAVCTF